MDISDFNECYNRTTKTAPSETYVEALHGLFPGEKFSDIVDMQGTMADKYGGDILASRGDTDKEALFFDNKLRATEKGQDVFFEAFHIFFKNPDRIPVDDRAAKQLLGKKVFFLLAEAFNKIPMAHRNLPEVFSAVNRVLSNHGEPFRVNPGWGLSNTLVSDVVLSTYPSGTSQAYRKDQVQKTLVQNFDECIKNGNMKVLNPSMTRERNGRSSFMTYNVAVDINWLSQKKVKVVSIPSPQKRTEVVKYTTLTFAEKTKIDAMVDSKLRHKGLLRSTVVKKPLEKPSGTDSTRKTESLSEPRTNVFVGLDSR